ncbi:hypothetical protein JCM11641_003648 [Rhodosporidiobolus odoratus]
MQHPESTTDDTSQPQVSTPATLAVSTSDTVNVDSSSTSSTSSVSIPLARSPSSHSHRAPSPTPTSLPLASFLSTPAGAAGGGGATAAPPAGPETPTNYSNAPELTHYLVASFVPSVVPQPEEYAAKEQARVYLEKLAEQVSPGARLLPFGSMANGFALKNSDMDLCCFLGKDAPIRSPSELVELLGRLIEQETNFYVKTLPRARIPIIKLTMPPTPSVPQGMACDIGFENRLALENTRLLLTYAMVDTRLRVLVLFLKVWTKRRKINNPYRGTLSSYGYVLLVIHFLAHVKQPAVLPNLQRLPLPAGTSLDELTYEGHDISFFDDVDQLSAVFQGRNQEPAGDLLIDFFRYFSKEYNYAHSVISIRSEKGTMQKVIKGWHTDFEFDPEVIVRDQHKLCIEDPFQLDYNVARTVTRDGLYTIRGEFMRAFRILTVPARGPDGISQILNSLCEEREDYLLIHPADQPYPQQTHTSHPPHHSYHQPHSHSHASPSSHHLHAPQPPKSPRRRSAPSPSPRMAPTHYSHQPPPLHLHVSNSQSHASSQTQREHPLWAAANGQGAVLSQPLPTSAASSRSGSRAPSEAGRSGGAAREEREREAGGEPEGNGLGLLDVRTPTMGAGPPLHPPPVGAYESAPRRPPSMGGRDTPVAHYRKPSWEVGRGGETPTPGPSTSAAVRPPPQTTAAGGASYDLHRFFQNPPSSSVSDVGFPIASTSSAVPSASASLATHPRNTVSLTAPSSPDMAASSAYFAGHPPAYGCNGRSSHRYSSSSAASSSSAGLGVPYSSHDGPRLAASVPRNPYTAHHAYTNPYASAPAPAYPLSSSASSTSSSSYTSAATHLGHAPSASSSTSAAATPGLAPKPAPIFPEEDREAIALANSITFGNFPEMLPLPSYAHYHASGGSAAYLSGSGGWGTTPYGITGPMRIGNRTHSAQRAAVLGRRPGAGLRRSLNGLGLDVDEDDEGEALVDALAGRGRRLANALDGAAGESGGSSRLRGRSVPHVRMGPDGRETLLFGAIEVTLPKQEDVEEAAREEREEEESRMRGRERDPERVKEREKEQPRSPQQEKEVELPRQSPPAASEEERPDVFLPGDVQVPIVDDIPLRAVRTIPVLTTQPPTPAKESTSARARGESSSPMMSAAALPPLHLGPEGNFITAPTSPLRSFSSAPSSTSPISPSFCTAPTSATAPSSTSPISPSFCTAPTSATEADVDRTPRAAPPSSSSPLQNGWTTLAPASPPSAPASPLAPFPSTSAVPSSPMSSAPLSPSSVSSSTPLPPAHRRQSASSASTSSSVASISRTAKSPVSTSAQRRRKQPKPKQQQQQQQQQQGPPDKAPSASTPMVAATTNSGKKSRRGQEEQKRKGKGQHLVEAPVSKSVGAPVVTKTPAAVPDAGVPIRSNEARQSDKYTRGEGNLDWSSKALARGHDRHNTSGTELDAS